MVNFFLKKNYTVLLLSFLAAVLFLLAASLNITGQGLYYDELHQATASFAYVGQPPFQFASLVIRGVPIMNMSYSGAIKTAVYGLYMWVFDAPFSVMSWRLVGILMVCAGLVLFGFILQKKISLPAAAAFFFLIITDISVLITTRHDWGPTALALMFRMIFIAVWIRGELSEKPSVWNTAWLGALVGISIFEKLSSVVLLFPLLLMLLFSTYRRNIRHFAAAAVGGFLGTLPLLLANLYSFERRGMLISLQFNDVERSYSASKLFSNFVEYLSLGAGSAVRIFILSNHAPVFRGFELGLVLTASLVLIAVFFYHRRANPQYRMVEAMLLSYVIILPILYFLPQNTWVHHWVIGTPFQYAAVALAVDGMDKRNILKAHRPFRYFAALIAAVVVIIRLSGLVSVEQSLLRGDASGNWDISLTRMGEFAATKSTDTLFVAADWGVATPIICFTGGRQETIIQPNFKEQNVEEMVNAIKSGGHSEFYLVFHTPPIMLKPEAVTEIQNEVSRLLAPEWEERPVEDQIKALRSVKAVRYVKVNQP